jgi:hypothetical protein
MLRSRRPVLDSDSMRKQSVFFFGYFWFSGPTAVESSERT